MHQSTSITEAQLEAMIDRAVWNRLATDSAYRNAEDAEQQSQRENILSMTVERELRVRHFPCRDCGAGAGEQCKPEYGCEIEFTRAPHECEGHPAGPFDDPMGQTVYCDGSCN